MLGGGTGSGAQQLPLDELVARAQQLCRQLGGAMPKRQQQPLARTAPPPPPSKRVRPAGGGGGGGGGSGGTTPSAIVTRTLPSIAEFKAQHFHARCPVLIRGAMQHWGAMGGEHRTHGGSDDGEDDAVAAGSAVQHGGGWADLGYLSRVAGLRTVPVELGSSYMSGDWSQRLMTFDEFLHDHVLQQQQQQQQVTGYLAQHQLFEQIPELRRDIMTPDYCCVLDDDDDEEGEEGGAADDAGADVVVNAWFGPAGTKSPTHHDPYHNLLCQVVGSKRVRLFAPDCAAALYCHEGMMSNTSQVDVDAPDHHAFPLFAQAPSSECVLRSGEMLYIPKGWFHYVVSLEVSFSVSFWWR